MRRFLKGLGYGEKGFTLVELLIIVAILGILAAVVVPNVASFIGAGNVAAANTEAANVRTAALAYYADNNATWPTTSADLFGGTVDYLDKAADATYDFDGVTGLISGATGAGTSAGLTFNVTGQQWQR